MAHRRFTDAANVTWDVWDTYPAEHGGAGASSLHVARELRQGWLTFESLGEKRRLAPVPSAWAASSEDRLAALCREATPARRARIAPSDGLPSS